MEKQKFQQKLQSIANEVNRLYMGEPDSETGFYNNSKVLSEFTGDNREFSDIFYSTISLNDAVKIEIHEPLSTELVIDRTIATLTLMLMSLEDSIMRLEDIQEQLKNEKGV